MQLVGDPAHQGRPTLMMTSIEGQAMREGVGDKGEKRAQPQCKVDVLDCIIGCKNEKDAIVEEDTLTGMKARCKASVNDYWGGNDV